MITIRPSIAGQGTKRWIRISELAKEARINRHTIHYYLKEDLLPPPIKTGRTMAFYSEVHLACLRFITELREKYGMPIAAMRQEIKAHFGDHWKATRSVVSEKTRRDLGKVGKKGERQRLRIIEMALELFSEKGYHRTHVSDITQALSISKGTFYQYFQNKHGLFVAIFDHLSRELLRTEEKIADEPDIYTRMQERGRAYFSFYKKYHKIFDIIRGESISQEDRPARNIQAIYRFILDPVIEDVRKAIKDGLFPSFSIDPEIIAYMVFGAFDFACYRLMMDHKYSPDDILEILVNLPRMMRR